MTAPFPLQSGGTSDDPFEAVSDFFSSSVWSFMSIVLRVFVVALWLALAVWTYQDARRRLTQPYLIAGYAVMALVLPIVGTVIYLLLRPPEYLMDARERDLELLALERRLGLSEDAEGRDLMARLAVRASRTDGGPLDTEAFATALRDAGVATREQLVDLERRLTELEFKLRRPDRASAARKPLGDEIESAAPRRREGRPDRLADPTETISLRDVELPSRRPPEEGVDQRFSDPSELTDPADTEPPTRRRRGPTPRREPRDV